MLTRSWSDFQTSARGKAEWDIVAKVALDDNGRRPDISYVALACNIDAKGKAVRLRIGLALVAFGAASTLLWAVPNGNNALAWVLSLALLGGGAFSVFEARAGWCAVRALGFKTRV